MQKGFYRSGLWIGRNPWKSVAGSVLLVVVCCSGFARWTPENRQEKLWVPQDSQAQADAVRARRRDAPATSPRRA